jgi:hypothetical protein
VLNLTLVKFGMTGTISLACDESANRAGMPATPTSMRKNMLLFQALMAAFCLVQVVGVPDSSML